MNKKSIIIENKSLTNGNILRLELFYTKGGISMLSGMYNTRGYYLSASPATINNGTVTIDPFSGLNYLIKPANRFSRKTLETLARNAKNNPMYQPLIQKTLITLTKPEA